MNRLIRKSLLVVSLLALLVSACGATHPPNPLKKDDCADTGFFNMANNLEYMIRNPVSDAWHVVAEKGGYAITFIMDKLAVAMIDGVPTSLSNLNLDAFMKSQGFNQGYESTINEWHFFRGTKWTNPCGGTQPVPVGVPSEKPAEQPADVDVSVDFRFTPPPWPAYLVTVFVLVPIAWYGVLRPMFSATRSRR